MGYPIKERGDLSGQRSERFMSGRLSQIQEWESVAREAEFRPGDMAALCSVSHRELQRYFEHCHQKTPRQWLRELQCRLAKQLITQGYSSKAAASDLKFANTTHFCREFKKVYGVSPQAFAPKYADGGAVSLLD